MREISMLGKILSPEQVFLIMEMIPMKDLLKFKSDCMKLDISENKLTLKRFLRLLGMDCDLVITYKKEKDE